MDSIGKLYEMAHHIHSKQQVAPSGAVPITVTSAGGAWTLGNFSNDIIAAAAVTFRYDIHFVIISTPSGKQRSGRSLCSLRVRSNKKLEGRSRKT